MNPLIESTNAPPFKVESVYPSFELIIVVVLLFAVLFLKMKSKIYAAVLISIAVGTIGILAFEQAVNG